MRQEFWHNCWEEGQIGFHLAGVNPLLIDNWSALEPETGTGVLVPLCGKSHDLRWLAEQGHRVFGIELNEKAVRSFFQEQQLQASCNEDGELLRFDSGNITIFCGDFFALHPDQLGAIKLCYDRASLVAMPPSMRDDYVRQLQQLLPSGARGLSITFDYDESEMGGPPFSVTPQEVARLFGRRCNITELRRIDSLADNPVLGERGLSRLTEWIFRLDYR